MTTTPKTRVRDRHPTRAEQRRERRRGWVDSGQRVGRPPSRTARRDRGSSTMTSRPIRSPNSTTNGSDGRRRSARTLSVGRKPASSAPRTPSAMPPIAARGIDVRPPNTRGGEGGDQQGEEVVGDELARTAAPCSTPARPAMKLDSIHDDDRRPGPASMPCSSTSRGLSTDGPHRRPSELRRNSSARPPSTRIVDDDRHDLAGVEPDERVAPGRRSRRCARPATAAAGCTAARCRTRAPA